MTSPPAAPFSYLVPCDGSFWRWSPGGDAIEWQDGRTIAFRGELTSVLTQLAPHGLPPLSAVVLLLAACRDNWDADRNRTLIRGRLASARRAQLRLAEKIEPIFDALEQLTTLPPDLRQATSGKQVIAETVFDASKREVATDVAEPLLHQLRTGLNPHEWICLDPPPPENLVADLLSMIDGLARLDADRLRSRLQTGIEQDVLPADLNLPPADRIRRLLTDLREDPELSGVATLAQKLLAAIHIPRALAAPQELPVGGVSDISNRGPLDRLLVSELAYDDEILTTRIALNEALFLRREAPSSQPPHGRVILMDTGIRMWGLPRVFATSVALALSASTDANGTLACYRPEGSDAVPVDLTSRSGLASHLQALHPAPHPADAVAAVVRAIADDSMEHDVMIVSHEDVLADPDFHRQLHAIDAGREWHFAAVNRRGDFSLQLLNPAGRRAICSAKLDLDVLLAKPKAKSPARPLIPLRNKKIDPDLPVILSMHPLPLLLPTECDPEKAASSETLGLIGVTHDHRLVQWTSPLKGARELSASTPSGKFLGIFLDEDREQVILVTHEQPKKLHVMIYDLKAEESQEQTFHEPIPWHAAFHGGHVLLMHQNSVSVLPPLGTADLTRVPLSAGFRWHSTRYYRFRRNGYFAAAFSGDTVMLHKVAERECRFLFDRPGDGPWQLLIDGQVANATGEPMRVEQPNPPFQFIEHVRSSSDGSRLVAHCRTTNGQQDYLLDLAAKPLKWKPVYPGDARALHGEAGTFASHSLTPRRWFCAITVEQGKLLLLDNSPKPLLLQLDDGGNLRLYRGDAQAGLSPRSFSRGRSVGGGRFRVRTARWSDGSMAVLDSRGMLHLKSSDRLLPEITLALTNALIAGWTSDGRTFGSAFFHAEPVTDEPAALIELIERFARRAT